MRHFLDIDAIDASELKNILKMAHDMKNARIGMPKGAHDNGAPLAGHILAMIFEKSSTRTRVSFDVGMRQLGGSAVLLETSTSQLGRGETIADTARVLSRMVDAIMLRANSHKSLVELARCTCNREKLVLLMSQMPKEDTEFLIENDGQIHARCEFCNTTYHIDPSELKAR